jgi:hypothetical protein
MKYIAPLLAAILMLNSCAREKTEPTTVNTSAAELPLKGTWKLFSATLIEKGDTITTDYAKNNSFIKIINDTHFAFLQHDLSKGKDSAASFSAGGGNYTLKDSSYTEHLEYCNAREWEGHDFTFNVTINNDTLVQRGLEVVESQGINRINIEKYVRLKL